METYLRCYHHSSCEDRPAVSRCTKCGKGLCAECTDKLRSNETGKMLCVDCLNDELAEDAAWALRMERTLKKEMSFITVGFIIGMLIYLFWSLVFIVGVISTGQHSEFLLFLLFGLYIPAVLSSFGTIVGEARGNGFILGLLIFAVMAVISPVMSVVRYVKRRKDVKNLKRFVALREIEFEANREYGEIARAMNTRLESMEAYRRKVEIQLSALYKNDIEERNRKIDELCAVHEEDLAKQAEQETKLAQAAQQVKDAKSQMDTAKQELEKSQKENMLFRKKAKAQQRSVDSAGSRGKAA